MSYDAVQAVLERTVTDPTFRTRLFTQPEEALAEYTARTFDGVDRALREVELVRQQKASGQYASDQMVGDALRHLQHPLPSIRRPPNLDDLAPRRNILRTAPHEIQPI